ncbi:MULTISPECIES: hypothetical protein [Streptomyces]|uniref:Uncharacterized protein n=1 Tax=Streptomyces botrytidirepellens TaxID=2486417 RepID=A0A3M8VMX4_9ACTN|nr:MULTISPECIES: hypothetical protein [Streptomyces]QLH22448.1 hypothetical protein HYQ63_19045 [Streptomyces sp. Rer75]RNG17781.1 hypothetical protein EEJ42_29495 [Streptomyces botrytidirepellens]
MARPWDADLSAAFARRLGRSAKELGVTSDEDDCPDIWELDNGDIAIVGRDRTDAYATRLPAGVTLAADERLVIIPGAMLRSAKPDIADA